MDAPILYIVATPIGTLSDLSPRAREILLQCDYIACEDTRHSGHLLSHFGVQVPLESLHSHNEPQKSKYLIDKLKAGKSKIAALITDAGTPAISDPGARFVSLAASEGIQILNIPGPSSLACALASSGFLQPRVIFSGFLPRDKNDQILEFERWKKVAPCIAVFFESPQRILSTLKNIQQLFIGREKVNLCVSREISKRFEEHIRGTPEDVLEALSERENIQGEIAVTVELAYEPAPDRARLTVDQAASLSLELAIGGNKTLKETVRELAGENHLSPKEVYNRAQELKNEADKSD